MTDFEIKPSIPKLLVSVRNKTEALSALEGGCDWLDVKDPSLGSLGAPSLTDLAEISTISGSFLGWSSALGELEQLSDDQWNLIGNRFPGLNLVKVGLSGCDGQATWKLRLIELRKQQPHLELAMVHYADRKAANSPAWKEIVDVAEQLESPIILIDTFSKNGQTLLDHLTLKQLKRMREELSALRKGLALAGSLRPEQLAILIAETHPNIVAVRGAACKAGRNSEVCPARVAHLKRIVTQIAL